MAAGKKTGGRKKGTPNKVTIAKAKEVADSGLTPLEYMLDVMRNPQVDPVRRDDMAKAAAPFAHHRLASIEHSGKGGGAILVKLDDADSRA